MKSIRMAVLEGKKQKTEKFVKDALRIGLSAKSILEKGLAPGILDAKEKYEKTHNGFRVKKGIPKSDVFTLKKIESTVKSFQKGLKLIEGLIKELSKGKIIFGVLKNKQDYGKNIILNILRAEGFEVIDIGNSVSPELLFRMTKEIKTDILALSIMTNQAVSSLTKLIRFLKKENTPVNLMIGGIAANPLLAESIGAFYAQNVTDVVPVTKIALKKSRRGEYRYLSIEDSFNLSIEDSFNFQKNDQLLQNFVIENSMKIKCILVEDIIIDPAVETKCSNCTETRTASCPSLNKSQKFSSYDIINPSEFPKLLKSFQRAILIQWNYHGNLNLNQKYRELTDKSIELEVIGRSIFGRALILKFISPCPFCRPCEFVETGKCRMPNKLRLNPVAVHVNIPATVKRVGMYSKGDIYALLLLGNV